MSAKPKKVAKPKNKYRCVLCDKTVPEVADLIEHFHANHPEEGYTLYDAVGTFDNTLADSAMQESLRHIKVLRADYDRAVSCYQELDKQIRALKELDKSEMKVNKNKYHRLVERYNQLARMNVSIKSIIENVEAAGAIINIADLGG